MNADVKARWVAALRSEDYQQNWGYMLRYGTMHTALGVLADLAVRAGVTEWVEVEEGLGHGLRRPGYPECYGLTPDVRAWAGLPKHADIRLNTGRTANRYLATNRVPFQAAALIIERHL